MGSLLVRFVYILETQSEGKIEYSLQQKHIPAVPDVPPIVVVVDSNEGIFERRKSRVCLFKGVDVQEAHFDTGNISKMLHRATTIGWDWTTRAR